MLCNHLRKQGTNDGQEQSIEAHLLLHAWNVNMIDQQELCVLCYLSNLKSKIQSEPLGASISLLPNPVKSFRDNTKYYIRVWFGVKRLCYLMIQLYELKNSLKQYNLFLSIKFSKCGPSTLAQSVLPLFYVLTKLVDQNQINIIP